MLNFEILNTSNTNALEKQLTDLTKRCFRGNPSIKYWEWCYLNNPIKKNYTSVAIKEKNVVGKNGNIPILLSVCGKEKIAILMEGLVVDENHRSWECTRGLLSTSYAEASKDDVALSYSFSTKAATKISETFGSKTIGQMPIQALCLDVEKFVRTRFLPFPFSWIGYLLSPFLAMRKVKQTNDELDFKNIAEFNSVTDEVSNKASNQQICVVKNSAYLNWRYNKHPDNNYLKIGAYSSAKCNGFIVFRIDKDQCKGYILELITQDCDVGLALIKKALQKMHQEGIHLVTASFPEDSLPRTCLATFGFRSWSTKLWDMHLVVLADPKKTSATAQDFSKWNFSLGDWIYF